MARAWRRWRREGPLALLAALSVAGSARADDSEELAALLDEHVVSGASKTDERAQDAPATTSVITGEEMWRYGLRSIHEAIDYLGMGMVTQNPLHSVEVGARGVLLTGDFGNHVLLVVDGHVMNEPWDGTAYFEQGAGIPIALIDHIELILGPGAVLYGGNAMLGVVNVVTKRADQFAGVHLLASPSVNPQQGDHGNVTSWAPADMGGTYRLGAGLGHSFTLFGRKVELAGQAELFRQDGPSFLWRRQSVVNDEGAPMNFGPRVPAGQWGGRILHQYRTSIPMVYLRAESGDLAVAFHAEQYRRSSPTANFNQAVTDFDEPRSDERDRFLSLDVQYKKRLGERFQLALRGYGDAYDYLQHQRSSEPSACGQPLAQGCTIAVYGSSSWGGLEAQGEYDWSGTGRNTTLVGVNETYRVITGHTDTLDNATSQAVAVEGAREASELVSAAYLQQRLTPLRFLHLNVGGRYHRDPRGGDGLSPRGAIAVDVWPGGVLKLVYAEAFRSPNFYEYFYATPYQRPNPALQSETVRSVESSLEQRLGRHKILFGVYHQWWSRLSALEPVSEDGSVTQYQNGGGVDNVGYNGRIDGAVGDLRYAASLTGAHSRRSLPDGTTESLPVAPQLFGNARVSYTLPGGLPTLALATAFVGRRLADRALDGNFLPTPQAPPSLDVRATLSHKPALLSGFSYRVGVAYTTASWVPYVAGPTPGYAADDPARGPAQLTPTVKLTAFASLHYDFQP